MNHEDRILNDEDRFAVDYWRTNPMTTRETNASRKADVLMKQYIKELVEGGVFSGVRPRLETADDVSAEVRDPVLETLQMDSVAATRIKQFISNLYDDVTGPQSLDESSYGFSGQLTWKEVLYERTIDWICEDTHRAHREEYFAQRT